MPVNMPAEGVDTVVGIALEPVYGAPCQAKNLINLLDDSVIAKYEKIRSQALRSSRGTRKGAAGAASLDGNFSLEVSPSLVTAQLLYAALGTLVTSAGAVIATTGIVSTATYFTVTTAAAHGLAPGATVTITGATPAGYNATWTVQSAATATTFTVVSALNPGPATVQGSISQPAWSHKFTPNAAGPLPFTHVIARGSLLHAHSCMASDLTLSADLDAILKGEVAVVGINERMGDRNTPARYTDYLGTAAYPTQDSFTFVQALVTIDGAANDDVKSFTTKIGNGIITQRSLARRRWAKAHGGGRLDISHTLDMAFATELQLRKYLGVSDALYPVIPTNSVLTGSVQLEFSDGVNILKILSPACEFECPAPAVSGEDFLSIQLVATALEDAGGQVQVTLVSNDTNATVIAPGTPIAAGS